MANWRRGNKPFFTLTGARVPQTLTDSSYATLATVTIPGGAMGKDGILKIQVLLDGDGDDQAMRIKLGATTFAGIAMLTNNSHMRELLICNQNSEAVQLGTNAFNASCYNSSGTSVSGTEDTSGDLDLIFEAKLGTSGTGIIYATAIVDILPQ